VGGIESSHKMETAWITLTANDLRAYQVAAIVTAAREEALGAGQADPFDEVMPDIIARIRAEVRGCTQNKVSNDPLTIPKDLKAIAIYLIIEAMQVRLNYALAEDLTNLVRDARKYLERVAKCEIPIGAPSDPETTEDVQSTAGTPRICTPTRRFDRRSQSGI
jgi:hypothetical protein